MCSYRHLSPFLYTGITFARLEQVGKVPQFKDILKSTVSGSANSVVHSLRITPDILSGPRVLVILVDLSTPMTLS